MNTTNPLVRFSQASLLALLSVCATRAHAGNFTLTQAMLDARNGYIDFSVGNIDGVPITLQPGDTIYIAAHTRPQIVLSRITQGSSTQPITITNTGGQFIIDTTDTTKLKGFTVSGCRNFVLKGTDVGTNYGIKIARTPAGTSGLIVTQHGGGDSGIPLTGSTNFELSDIQIANTGFAGLFIKCDSLKASSGFVMQDVKVHDLDISNTGGEGMYIGYHAFQDSAFDAHEIRGIEIHHNTITNTGWDGIQLGCATQNASIHDNEITGYGLLAPNVQQDEGIRANPGTAADIYNNKIKGSSALSGTGIFANPYNSMKIYNNVIITPEEAGIVVHETWDAPRGYVAGYSVKVFNNTIVSPAEEQGIRFVRMQHSGVNLVQNNIITQASAQYISEDVYSDPVVTESFNLTATASAAIGFVNAAADDFHLTTSSAAVNTGTNLSGSGVTDDYDGIARPQGAAYDKGAFEYVAPGILTPAAWGQAGSAYCPATGAFNEQPTWDSANARPSGSAVSAYTTTGTAYANRYWYIDFGPNYANIRITGSWTRYMPLTTGSYSGFGAMWWDDDNDSTNDNGVAASGINFCTGQNLNTGSAQLWVRDTDNASTPVAPQRRYLIINTGSAPAARVNEFALSGYILN